MSSSNKYFQFHSNINQRENNYTSGLNLLPCFLQILQVGLAVAHVIQGAWLIHI